MSWHFLQGQEEASWAGSCLDGAPSALLKLIPTADGSCLPANGMESCIPSQSGTTCEPSMANHGVVTSTSLAEVSPARTSALQARERESTGNEAGFGLNTLGSLGKYDPVLCSWKTPQTSLFAGLDEFSENWPRWGLMRDGECWERMPLALHISENGSGSLPTPVKYDSTPGGPNNHYKGLGWMAKHQWAKAPRGGLNPAWVEWLMGWPIGWTELQPLATDKSQLWLDSHGRR